MIHGTRSGYYQHRQAGETACRSCLDANNLHSRTQWRKHHPKPVTVADRILDVVSSHEPVTVKELPTLLPDLNPASLRRTVHRMLNQDTLTRLNGVPLTIGTP